MINKIKNKKAQLKIQEMMFMLLALFLFFVIAGLFFLVITTRGIKGDYDRIQEQKTISMVSKLAESPEFYCSNSQILCVDMDKILALKQSNSFLKYWETSGGIIVKKIYPDSSQEIECSLTNYDTCTKITLKEPSSDYSEISSFVSLCKKDTKESYVYDKCELGEISIYLKKE